MGLVTTSPNTAFGRTSAGQYGAPSSNALQSNNAAELKRIAVERLNSIASTGRLEITESMLGTLIRVFTLLVADGGPTPQLGATSDGTLEVQWLVNGNLVQVDIEPGGDWSLWAVTAGHEELVDEEYVIGGTPSGKSLNDARRILAHMGRGVRFPVDR